MNKPSLELYTPFPFDRESLLQLATRALQHSCGFSIFIILILYKFIQG